MSLISPFNQPALVEKILYNVVDVSQPNGCRDTVNLQCVSKLFYERCRAIIAEQIATHSLSLKTLGCVGLSNATRWLFGLNALSLAHLGLDLQDMQSADQESLEQKQVQFLVKLQQKVKSLVLSAPRPRTTADGWPAERHSIHSLTFRELSFSVKKLKNLTKLCLKNVHKLPSGFDNVETLKHLEIRNMNSLGRLNFSTLKKLEFLVLENIMEETGKVDISDCHQLKHVEVSWDRSQREPHGQKWKLEINWPQGAKFEYLKLNAVWGVSNSFDLSGCRETLTSLYLNEAGFESNPGIDQLKNIEHLLLHNIKYPGVFNFNTASMDDPNVLDITHFTKLQTLSIINVLPVRFNLHRYDELQSFEFGADTEHLPFWIQNLDVKNDLVLEGLTELTFHSISFDVDANDLPNLQSLKLASIDDIPTNLNDFSGLQYLSLENSNYSERLAFNNLKRLTLFRVPGISVAECQLPEDCKIVQD